MSPSRSLVGLLIATLALVAAILAGDSGSLASANRELLILGLLAAAALTIQSALAWHAARAQATAVIFVREGAVRRSTGQIATNDRLRSVSLAVESGQAVVVERNGLFSRVLRPGLSALEPGETVYKVVSTQPRVLIGNVACATREGITVTVGFEVSAQIMPSADDRAGWGSLPKAERPAAAAQLPPDEARWSEDALVRAAYETHSWESAVLNLARSSLRDQFARSYLSDIHLPAVSPHGTLSLESLQSRCRRRMSVASSAIGVSIEQFQIAHLGVPAELAGGYMSVTRARPPLDKERPTDVQGDGTASQPWTAIRLASVLGGGPFATFRQAMRARTGDVIIPDVLLEGNRWVGRALGQTDPVPFELLPDRIHYDIQIHGRNFQTGGLCDGEHLLFASLPEPADGDIVAVAVDGQMELRRYWQKTDHVLLEPERESQPLVAVVTSDEVDASVRAEYNGSGPAIEIRQAASVKVLGHAAIAFGPAVGQAMTDRIVRRSEPHGHPDSDAGDTPAPPAGCGEADPGG